MAMPVHMGRKTPAERFPGAVETLTIEALMRDGKALQSGTSHYLGENFARAYGVTFLGRDGEEHYAQATSWGSSTRPVGGLIMAHGDQKGVRLPPLVAPVQVVIVPVYPSDDERSQVVTAVGRMAEEWRSAGFRIRVDDRDDLRPGFKFADHELRGVPIRVEVGPRDLEADQVTVVRRDTGEKSSVPTTAFGLRLPSLLDGIQQALFDDAPRVSRRPHPRGLVLRRAPRRDRCRGWVRRRGVVRPSRVRGEGEGRDHGDDQVPARGARGSGVPLFGLRQPRDREGDLGDRVLSLAPHLYRPRCAPAALTTDREYRVFTAGRELSSNRLDEE